MSIRRVVAMETVTLTDLTDAIISGTEPDVKTDGMLWIDGDNILKQWNGVSWDKVELDVSSLDPDLSETITTILGKVGSIADDGVLDFEDRKVINEEVALIIGDYPSTTLTSYTALPDYNDFDSNPRGSFGRVRETTRSVVGGTKARSLPEYVALASAFQKLGDLLIKTRPVRMWDITTMNKDVVITLSDHGITPDDLRTGLLNYYMAELSLSEYNNQMAVEVSKDYTDENIKDTVKEMVHMYAYSDSMTEPPQEGVPWVYEPLSPVEDRYIWMRTRVIYKNGDESSSEPYLSSFDITATLGDLDQKTNNPAFSDKGLEGGGVEVEFGGGIPAPEEGAHELDIVSSVGGRNLLRDSGIEVSNGVYHIARYDLTDEIKEEEEVTLTIWGSLATTKSNFRAYNSGGSVSLVTLTDNGDGTYSRTFKWSIGSSTNTYLNVYAFTNDQTGISTINKIKLEKGNKATVWTPAPEDIPYDTLVDGVYKTKAEFPSDETYSLPSFPKSNYVYSVGDFEPQLTTRWKSPGWKRVNTMQDDMVIMGNNIDTTMEGTRQMIYQLRDGVNADGSEYRLNKFHNIVDTVDYHTRTIKGENDDLATTVMTSDMFSRTIGTAVSRLEYPNNVNNTGTGVARNSHTFSLAPGMILSKGMTLQFKTSLYPKSYRVTILKDDDKTLTYNIHVTSEDHGTRWLTTEHEGGAKTLTISLADDNSTTFTLSDVQLTEKQPEDLYPLPFHDSWSDGNFSRIIQLENSIRNEVVFGGRVVSAIETNLEGVRIQGKTITFDGDFVEMTNLNVRNLKGDTAKFLRVALNEGIGDSITDGFNTRIAPNGIKVARYGDDGVIGGQVSYGPFGMLFYSVSNGVLGDIFGGVRSVNPGDGKPLDVSMYTYGDSRVSLGYVKDDGLIYNNLLLEGNNQMMDSWVDVDMHGYWLKTGRARLSNWGLDLLGEKVGDNEQKVIGRIALSVGTSNIEDLIIGRPEGGDILLATKGGPTGSYVNFMRVNSTLNRVDFYRDISMNNKRILNQSDGRLKENITPTRQNSLELTQKFNFYDYDFIDGEKDRLGIVAQELQKIAPEIVEEDEDGYLSYDSNRLFMTFGHATQQFYKEYEQEIKKLKEELRQLKEKL